MNKVVTSFFGGIAIGAVVLNWATQYFDPSPQREFEDTFVKLRMSEGDKTELDRMLAAIVQGAKKQGITISDTDEVQLTALFGWATLRVLSIGKPDYTYIVEVPSEYALAKIYSEYRLTPSNRFQHGNNKDCIRLRTSLKEVDGKSSGDESTHCMLNGKWQIIQEDN